MNLSREQIIERIELTRGDPTQRTVDLSGLDLRGVDLSSLDLRGADLSRADLTNADLRWTILEGADLHATVLRQADARWSVLRGANLRQADLGRVNLAWADVAGADMTDAKLEGAVVDSVDLGSAYTERRGRAPRGGASAGVGRARGGDGIDGPGGGDGIAGRLGTAWAAARGEGGWLAWLPPLSPATGFALAAALVVLIQFWGWLYRHSYYVAGFRLEDKGLITFTDPANFIAGLLNVLGLTLTTLLASPVIVVALLLVIALFAALPVGCYLLAQRLLRDTVRSPGRPIVVFGLFVAFFAGYYLLIPSAVQAGGAVGRSLPATGWLGAVFALWRTGDWLAQLGLLAVLVALAVPLWTIWRVVCIAASTWQPPADWRLRYPALNAAAVQLRGSRVMSFSAPLTDLERRRAGLTVVGIVLGLATVLTFTGRVFAQRDMCDGGGLPRVQLVGKLPSAAGAGAAGATGGVTRAATGQDAADAELIKFTSQLNPKEFCARELLQTDDTHFLFFPSETGHGASALQPVVYRVPAASVARIERGTGDNICPTCEDGPNGRELALLDPAEGRYEGVLKGADAATGLLTLEEGPAVRFQAGITRLLSDGVALDDPTLLVPGQTIVAYGQLNNADPTSPVVDAREVRAITPKIEGVVEAPGGTVTVELSNPRAPLIGGTGWTPGATLSVGIALRQANLPPSAWSATPVTQITAGPDGAFSAPVEFNDQWPTGPNYAVIVQNMTTRETAVGDAWLQVPPPTPIPTPTPQIFQPSEEAGGRMSPTPDNSTPTPQPTNTPLPTPVPPTPLPPKPGDGSRFCTDPDDYEPDSTRGQQKTILVGIGESTETQKHNFCSDFDIDLATFPVKGGRWYRVFTKGLAAGVDTVLAVGDLPGGTNCQPWNDAFGCWSDDASALTFESEVVFQAGGDGQVIVTVDNRGPSAGPGATYELGVVMFQQGTATPVSTETPKPTPTPTRTPTPMKDSYTSNTSCPYASAALLEVEIRAPMTGNTSSYRDYFKFELEPDTEYRTEMRPPSGLDYDIIVGPWQNTTACPQYAIELNDGDGTERYDWPKYSVRTTVYVAVYATGAYDPSRPYRLKTFRKYAPSEWTPTATATFAPGVPTPTPPPPTPISPVTARPPSPTPANPTVTPTTYVPFETPSAP
ncbi:MAG: pentapeptide repeat-containing protein [Ardenticatenales bacterium]